MNKYSDLLKVNISIDADIYILSYKLNKFLEKNNLINPAISLVARELATNILKYGTRGFIEVTYDGELLVITADDMGKNNVELSRKGLGIGLDVVKNNCDKLEITKKRDGGSTVKATFLINKDNRNKFSVSIGVASKPHYLESKSGDICVYKKVDDRYFIFIADILGHGERAYETAVYIKAHIEKLRETAAIQEILVELTSLPGISRGFAGFIGYISHDRIEYINIGNIRIWIITPYSISKLIETPGIIGKTPLPLKTYTEHITSNCFSIIACTDGIKRQFTPTRQMYWIWDLNPHNIANKIINDFGIKEDDSTVLVAKGGSVY